MRGTLFVLLLYKFHYSHLVQQNSYSLIYILHNELQDMFDTDILLKLI